MPDENYKIRKMLGSEVDMAIELAAQEGWNPGLHDSECFYKTDPAGFLIGVLNDQPIGCISAVSYENNFGFIGLYIVKPVFRRLGYGIRLFQAALQQLEGQSIGLDGVIEQEQNYMKFGFQTAYRNRRFEGLIPELPRLSRPEIVSLNNISFLKVNEYDRQCFPSERSAFLTRWISMPDSTALGLIEQDNLKGFGVVRQCYHGYKIGPLFADNSEVAETIYLGLVSRIPAGLPVYLDVPDPNSQASVLVQKFNLREVFATVRMYSRGEPHIDLDKVYGVTTFELG